MRQISAIAILFLLANAAHAADKSQPRSLDPELKIELFAEHPTIVTPTGIDVDHKGRVFAVESNTHFPPSGYKGHKSDRVLVLEDTNGNGKADKTTVFADGLTHTMSVKVMPLWLEDSGQQSAVSDQKRNRKSAIRNPQSVYVATRRDIFLYTDTNGDLKADGRKQIIHLETKGNYPHNGLAGIAFDAMGWMYFGFGENLGADYTIIGSDGTKLSGGGEGGNVYRCKPDGSKLTRWATGFWNPHASCVDAFGRLFTVDNDPDSRPPCRLLHVIEGGDYGFRFRNGRKGLHPFTAWNGEIPGTLPMVAGTGEAPSGIVAYESDGLPKKYIGNLLVGSWGDHRIDRFVLKPKGASFVSRAEPIIQGGEDFRPVGLAVAPDGSVFCTDWVKRDYKLHGHGRVWRISRKPSERGGVSPPVKRAKVIDLSTITPKRPVKELTALLSHPRLEVRRMAARAVRVIGSKQAYEVLDDVFRSDKSSEKTRAEILWQVAKVGDHRFPYFARLGEPSTKKEMKPVSDPLAVVLLQIQMQFPPQYPRGRKDDGADGFLAMMASQFVAQRTEKSRMENKQQPTGQSSELLVRYLQFMPWKDASGHPDNQGIIRDWKELLWKFSKTVDPFEFSAMVDATSTNEWKLVVLKIASVRSKAPQMPLFLLLAIRKTAPRNVEVVKLGLQSPSPDVRRVAVQWVAEENLKELKPQVEAVLNGKVMNADLFLATLAALEMLDGKRPQDFDKTPAGKYVLPLVKDPNRPAAVRAIALRLVDPDDKSLSESLFTELLASKDAGLKAEAIRTLSLSQQSFAGTLLAGIALDENAPAAMRADAVAGLSGRSFEDAKTSRDLLKLTAASDHALRTEAVRSFRNLLMKTAAGRPVRVRLIRQFGEALKREPRVYQKDDSLRQLAEVLAAGYRQAGIALPDELKEVEVLRPATLTTWYAAAKPQAGDVHAGRRVFFASNGASCYRCHTVNGRGGKIGPDLSTIARTADRRKLAESILEPSKEIAPQYTLWSFVMDDGKVHHGVILGDTRNGLRQQIGTPEGRIVELPLNSIELRTPQSKSAMPDRLIDQLTATEFRDLLAFLETLK